MDKVEILWDIEQIKQLKARYFRCVDTKDWEGFCEVFSDDIDWTWLNEKNEIVQQVKSKSEMREWVLSLDKSGISVHHGHMPEIEIIDEKNAKGIWPMMDMVLVDGPECVDAVGYGHYHEEYIKGDDDKWKIRKTLVTRLRMDYGPNHTKPY